MHNKQTVADLEAYAEAVKELEGSVRQLATFVAELPGVSRFKQDDAQAALQRYYKAKDDVGRSAVQFRDWFAAAGARQKN